MHPSGQHNLRTALAGREAKAAYQATRPEFDPTMFTDSDWATLTGPWSWFHSVVEPAMAHGPNGLIDDDMAYVTPWGFDCAQVTPPVLLVHGGADRVVPAAHSAWLARHCPAAELWLQPEDGHLSALGSSARALDWLGEHA